MFSIILHGEALDLNEGQELTLVSEGNLFSDALQAEGSELISLAATAKNLRLLGHVDVLDIAPGSGEYACMVSIGMNAWPARLVLKEVSTEGINAYVLYNMGQLTCFEKNCQDFDWQVPVATLPAQFHQGCSQLWPQTPFYFPLIGNKAFYDDIETDPSEKRNEHFAGFINQAERIAGQYVPLYNYIQAPDYINRNTLVPMVPVLEIFKRALASDGYTLQGDWPNTPVMGRLFMYNNKSLDRYGNTLEANASNILGYLGQFNGDKLNFTTTDNPLLFNANVDEYEVTEEGNYAYEVKITLVQAYQLAGPKVQLFENNLWVDEILFSAADYANGQYVFVFQRSYNALQIGTKVQFRLAMQGSPAATQISNLQLKARKIIGVGLIQFSAITNLKDHVPDMRFADFFNAWLAAFQLHPAVDVEKKIFYINYRKQALNPVVVKDLEGAALLPIRQQWQEVKGYKLFWNVPDEDQPANGLNRQGIYLNTKSEPQLQEKKPEGNEGEEVGTGFSTMLQDKFTLVGYGTDAQTLHLNERGQSEPLELAEQVTQQRIGLIAVVNQDAVALNTLPELNLYWQNNAQSIGGYAVPWLQFVQRSARLFVVSINPRHPLADGLKAGEAVRLMHNTFFIHKITRSYGARSLRSISLELRKL